MINADGFASAHGMPVGIADREVPPPESEVKTRIMTDEERAALDAELAKKVPPKQIKIMHLSPTGKQTRKEKIISMLHQGYEVQQIAEKLGVNKSLVYYHCRELQKKISKMEPEGDTEMVEQKKVDAVHPDYYKGKSGRDVFDVAMDFNLNALSMNALKYIVRAGRKDPTKTIEDLNKAIECLEREKQFVAKES